LKYFSPPLVPVRISRVPAILLATGLLAAICPAVTAAPAAAAPKPFVGLVSEDAFGGTPSYRGKVLKKIAGLKVGTMRQTLDWAIVEPSPGSFNWTQYDAWVQACAQRKIRVLPVLFNTPAWASSRPAGSKLKGTYPPNDSGRFAAFAAAAAQRYGPNGTFWATHPGVPVMPITSWQLWNEQNLHQYWLPKANAAQYVGLLRATSLAIKQVNPGAEIVTGGMPNSRLGVPLKTYIRQIYAAGGADTFDSIATNPYGKSAKSVLAKLKQVRKVMNAAHDTGAGLWVSEIGWSDTGPRNSFRLGSRGQAKAIRKLLPLLYKQRKKLKLKSVIYYNWRDAKPYPGGKEFWGLHTGLVKRNGKPKRAYSAFKSAARGLR
jgi:hypothetical protein